jgi:hypothetical protein
LRCLNSDANASFWSLIHGINFYYVLAVQSLLRFQWDTVQTLSPQVIYLSKLKCSRRTAAFLLGYSLVDIVDNSIHEGPLLSRGNILKPCCVKEETSKKIT